MREQAEQILVSFGLTLGDCVNILIAQIIRTKGVPFDMKPSPETQTAIDIVRRANETGNTSELLPYASKRREK
jgi:addiction module RelB/DinJ family antitoxin